MPQEAETTMPPLPRFGDRPHTLHSSSKQTTHFLGAVTHEKCMNQSILEETESRRTQGWADQGSLSQGSKPKDSSNNLTEGREAFPEGGQHYVGQTIGRLR